MSNPKVRKIAFLNICTKEWIAGCNYLHNLFLALRSLPNCPEIYLLNLTQTQDDSNKMLLPLIDGLIQMPAKRPLIERIHYALQNKTGLPLGSMNPIEKRLHENDIEILFTGKGMGKNFNLPFMFWIPDFQHIHLPHMFPEEERKKRDKTYKDLSQTAHSIVLSSHDALKDMQAFAPAHTHKMSVMNFVAHVPPSVYEVDSLPVAEQYHLPKKFFYLPNQFWQHKNHRIVIEALGLLRESHPEISVVCSGNTSDYRQPKYFNELLNLIAEKGVHEQFRMLGMIPFEHIFPLIRQSVAVIQPSLFEGWSTTVEETKSLGKQLILSDIPVHREQNPPGAVYFNPKDPQELADCLVKASEKYRPGPNLELEAESRAMLHERLSRFGQQFMAIVERTLES